MDKFDDVFKILREYSFEIDETNKDYLCIICKNILSNAHSGPCDCRFCYDCIDKLLNGKEKFCPGDTNECKQGKLNLIKNIHYEPSVNTRISKLIVKCPKGCQFKDEIRNIENHIRVCNFRQINCPYFNIGCKQSNLINDNMKNHFLSDIVTHSNLLLELIENMRNEMELLKKDIGELKNENKSLKNENKSLNNEIETINLNIKENQIQISELKRKEQKNNDNIVELNEEMMVLKNDNRYLKDEIERMKNDKTNKNMSNTIETTKTNVEREITDFDIIRLKLEMMENKQNEFMNKYDQNYQLINTSKNSSEMINPTNCRNNLKKKISETEGTFEWKIDNFSHLNIGEQIDSEPFSAFPNGYQMCMSIVIDVNTEVYSMVSLHLMRGKYDYSLYWPCKCDVRIELINQNNHEIYKSETIKFNNRKDNPGWNKLKNEKNNGIIFLTLSLNAIEKLLKNDQLLIKCKTNIPQPTYL